MLPNLSLNFGSSASDGPFSSGAVTFSPIDLSPASAGTPAATGTATTAQPPGGTNWTLWLAVAGFALAVWHYAKK
jgi:hypothetical protein